jgi:type I restriction enzyme M protein
MLNPRTCGVYKNGSIRYKVDEHGERGSEIDNEMLDHVLAWKAGELPPGAVEVPIVDTVTRDVLVPSYYDSRRDAAFDALKVKLGCDEITLGQFMARGLIEVHGGHGSVSNDQRVGGVPYVKVSDIRALRVNINPTNMIPLALAKKKWGGRNDSALSPWDLITPNRASSNIGEFAMLLPGEEKIVLTKEMFIIRVTKEGLELFDPFYLMWAFSLRAVRDQWRRATLMQTNREDVGERHREVRLPLPPNRSWADPQSSEFRKYFQALAAAKTEFLEATKNSGEEFIGSIYVDAAPELVEAEQVEEGIADVSVLTDDDPAHADKDDDAEVAEDDAHAEIS